MPESKEERVARITAKQTIVVTVITVLGALGGASIQHVASRGAGDNSHPATPINQDWFTVENIELVNRPPEQTSFRIRLVTTINNKIKYSYPSPVIWEPIEGDLPDEAFPLPMNSSPYSVSFVMYLDDPLDGPVMFHSQETIEIEQSPIKSEAKLVGFTPGSRATAPSEIQARVRFSIESK